MRSGGLASWFLNHCCCFFASVLMCLVRASRVRLCAQSLPLVFFPALLLILCKLVRACLTPSRMIVRAHRGAGLPLFRRSPPLSALWQGRLGGGKPRPAAVWPSVVGSPSVGRVAALPAPRFGAGPRPTDPAHTFLFSLRVFSRLPCPLRRF